MSARSGCLHKFIATAQCVRCDYCGEPWTGGMYEAMPGPTALTDEERAKRAAKLAKPLVYKEAAATGNQVIAYSAWEVINAFEAGYLAALKEAGK